MNCDELEARLVDSEEGLRDADLESHLASCTECRTRKERIEGATRRLGDLVRERARPLSPDFKERVLAAAMPASASPSQRERQRRFHPGLLAMALVAAGLGFVLIHAPVEPVVEHPQGHGLPASHDADAEIPAVAAVASSSEPAPGLALRGGDGLRGHLDALDVANARLDSATVAVLAEVRELKANNVLTVTEENEIARDIFAVNVAGVSTETRAVLLRNVDARVGLARKRNMEINEARFPNNGVIPTGK